MSIQQAMFMVGGDKIDILGGTYQSTELSPTDAYVIWELRSTGLVNVNVSSGTDVSYNWITPTSNAGNYYVRVTPTSGDFSSSSGTGTWLATSANRFWRVDFTGSFGQKSCTFTVEIATDAAGTNIVETQTDIVITAIVEQ